MHVVAIAAPATAAVTTTVMALPVTAPAVTAITAVGIAITATTDYRRCWELPISGIFSSF